MLVLHVFLGNLVRWIVLRNTVKWGSTETSTRDSNGGLRWKSVCEKRHIHSLKCIFNDTCISFMTNCPNRDYWEVSMLLVRISIRAMLGMLRTHVHIVL